MTRLVMTALMLASLAVAGHADFARGAQTLAFFGGAGGSGETYDLRGPEEEPITGVGGAWGAQYLYYLTDSPSFAVGVDAAVSANGPHRTVDLLDGFDTTARLKSGVYMAVARLSWPKGVWRPYIFSGLGVHHSSVYLSAKPGAGRSWSDTSTTESRVLTEDKATSLALGYGIGMDLFAGERFFMGFELRGAWLAGLDDERTPDAVAAGIPIERESATQGNILGRIGMRF